MTRKHFEAIAMVLNNLNVNGEANQADTVAAVIRALAREFKQFNPNFDEVKFAKACGVVNV
jgi:hypothetical protein